MMKKIGIIGTGIISSIIEKKLKSAGYEVMVGTAESYMDVFEQKGSIGKTAFFGDIIFLCIKKEAVLPIVKLLPAEAVNSKTIIDITNPLDYSSIIPPYMIPELINCNTLGEELQDAIPNANIVKALNLSSSDIMVSPQRYNGNTTMFITGNDSSAKKEAKSVLCEIGWTDIIDLGDISIKKRTEKLHLALNMI